MQKQSGSLQLVSRSHTSLGIGHPSPCFAPGTVTPFEQNTCLNDSGGSSVPLFPIVQAGVGVCCVLSSVMFV